MRVGTGMGNRLVHILDNVRPHHFRPNLSAATWRCGRTAVRATIFDSLDDAPSVRRCVGCFEPELARMRAHAQQAVNKAIQNGFIKRMPCEECGNPIAQAHHDDYSKPLVVRWLCNRDHGKWHQLFAASFGASA